MNNGFKKEHNRKESKEGNHVWQSQRRPFMLVRWFPIFWGCVVMAMNNVPPLGLDLSKHSVEGALLTGYFQEWAHCCHWLINSWRWKYPQHDWKAGDWYADVLLVGVRVTLFGRCFVGLSIMLAKEKNTPEIRWIALPIDKHVKEEL